MDGCLQHQTTQILCTGSRSHRTNTFVHFPITLVSSVCTLDGDSATELSEDFAVSFPLNIVTKCLEFGDLTFGCVELQTVPRRKTERDVPETAGTGGRRRRMSLRWKAKTGGPSVLMPFHLGDIRLCHPFSPSQSRRRTSPRRMAPRRMTLRRMTPRRMTLRRMSPRRMTLRRMSPRRMTLRRMSPRRMAPRRMPLRRRSPRRRKTETEVAETGGAFVFVCLLY